MSIKTRKKILHLITGLEVGGTERILLKTLPHLQGSFDNRVCCIIGHGPIGKQLEDAGIQVFYLDFHPISLFGSILQFRSIIKDFQPELLITYLIHADLFGRIFGHLFGIKRVVCSQRGKLLQWEFLRTIDYATKFLVTSYIVQTEVAKKELMKKLRLSSEKITVIPNVIDSKEFEFDLNNKKKRASLGLSASNIIITCVSKLRRGKGHEYLLEAFESIHKGHPETKLLIVGDGERKQELLDQVSDYSSKPSILFLGNRNDVKEILRISDIFVLPTLGEGMSNAIMEAMVSSLPVITTDLPENKELIKNQVTGLLIPIKNHSALYRTISLLLNDATLRKSIGGNAKDFVKQKFSLHKVTEKLRSSFKNF